MKTSVDKAARTMWVVTALRYILLVLGTRSWVSTDSLLDVMVGRAGGSRARCFLGELSSVEVLSLPDLPPRLGESAPCE